jgi:hypothetical protein
LIESASARPPRILRSFLRITPILIDLTRPVKVTGFPVGIEIPSTSFRCCNVFVRIAAGADFLGLLVLLYGISPNLKILSE